MNSPTQACVKVTIVSHGFDCICRTSLVVHVMKKSLKCICRDGRVMYLSYEPQELRDLIFCQVNIDLNYFKYIKNIFNVCV